MKTKRFLALAMAMVMTFVVFAIPASAVPSGAFLKAVVQSNGSNEVTVAPGETFTVTFALETEQIYNKWNGGVITLAWDNTKVDYVSGSVKLLGKWAEVMNASDSITNADQSTALIGLTWDSSDTTKGYNAGLRQVAAESIGDYALTDGEVLLSYDFTAKEGITGETYIGIPEGAYKGSNPCFYLTPDSSWGFPMIEADDEEYNIPDFGMTAYDKSADDLKVTIKEAAVPTVEFVQTQSKWIGGTPGSNYAYGFVGKLSNYDVKTSGTSAAGNPQVSNLDRIDVALTIDGEVANSEAYTLYPDGTGAYKFRAIVTGFKYTDTNSITNVAFKVIAADKTTVICESSDTLNVTPNSIYEASCVVNPNHAVK